MNDTIHRFGYPETLIAEYANWVVLLRPEQPTLGSLVLAAKSDVTAFSDLEPAAFAELANVTWHIETAIERAIGYGRINYLMLMMVDPHVHFHVLPRYSGSVGHAGVDVADKGWPGAPMLAEAVPLTPAQIDDLVAWLKGVWPDVHSIR